MTAEDKTLAAIAELRAEMRSEFGAVRQEMRAEFKVVTAHLRTLEYGVLTMAQKLLAESEVEEIRDRMAAAG